MLNLNDWKTKIYKTLIGSATYIDESRGCHRHSPQWDPILSFLHTFLPKSARVGGLCHPPMAWRPPTGNTGSTTDMCFE